MKRPSIPKVHVRRPTVRLPFRRAGAVDETADGTTLLGGAAPSSAAHALEPGDVRILRGTRLRLMAVSGLVTAVILAGLGFTLYSAVSNLIVSDSVSKLEDSARLAVGPLTGAPPPSGRTLDRQWGTRFSDVFLFISISAPDGSNIVEQTEGHPPGMPVTAAVAAAGSSGTDMREVTTSEQVQLRVYTMTGQTTFRGATYQYFVQTAVDRTEEINLLSLLRSVLLVGGLAALLLSLLAGYLYAGRALVPIRASMTRRELALKRQREFAANASHELRTPLTVIGASVEDLKRNRRSRVEDVGEALGDIDAEVRHMTALVEDLLLLARTDSGVIEMEKVPLDLADVAVEAVSMLSSVADERQVRLEVDPLPVFVLGDQLRLRQLVTILTDNAIKHTRHGSTVRVHVHPDAGAAVLRVDDEGAGVRPEDLPRIFERFWRADDAPAGGTGLGLSIAKWIVEQHGGVIGAYNRAEGGATFWARLPQYSPAMSFSEPTGDAPEPPAGDTPTGGEAADQPIGQPT